MLNVTGFFFNKERIVKIVHENAISAICLERKDMDVNTHEILVSNFTHKGAALIAVLHFKVH